MNSKPSDHASLASSPTALYHQVAQTRVSPLASRADGLPVMEAAPPQNMSTATTTTAASGEAVSQKRVDGRKPVDKRSLDYVLRSGLAGGIAGCAVSLDMDRKSC